MVKKKKLGDYSHFFKKNGVSKEEKLLLDKALEKAFKNPSKLKYQRRKIKI